MFKSTLRGASRATITSRTTSGALRNIAGRRFASSGPNKKRTWKSGAARWIVAGAGVWWYNTSDVFKEDPAEAAIQRTKESLHRIQESDSPTIDAIVEEKRARAAERVAEDERRQKAAESAVATEDGEAPAGEEEDGLGGLEEEADQQGAFNPETGEINWDCPCLGGMAHGPCGDEFRAAFSCFVYSKEEPKGVECIEKFKGMQDCFRQHPEMYESELEDDEDKVEEELRARESAKDEEAALTAPKETLESSPKPTPEVASQPEEPKKAGKEPHKDTSATTVGSVQKVGDDGGDLVAKSAHDAT